VEIYSIGIFDPYAPTPEERTVRSLLDDTQLRHRWPHVRVDDVDEMSDMPRKPISPSCQPNVIGTSPRTLPAMASVRKVKGKGETSTGCLPATVYARHRVLCAIAIRRFLRDFRRIGASAPSPADSCSRNRASGRAVARAHAGYRPGDARPTPRPSARPLEAWKRRAKATCCMPTWKRWVLNATVLSGSQLVENLTRDDFTVMEDGVKQNIISFQHTICRVHGTGGGQFRIECTSSGPRSIRARSI